MFGRKNFRILIVEDDLYFNKIIYKHLQNLCNPTNYPKTDFDLVPCFSSEELKEELEKGADVILLDHYIDDGINDGSEQTGVQLMDLIRKKCPRCRVVVVSGQEEMATTAEFFKKGAIEYVQKDDHVAERIWSIVEDILRQEKQKVRSGKE